MCDTVVIAVNVNHIPRYCYFKSGGTVVAVLTTGECVCQLSYTVSSYFYSESGAAVAVTVPRGSQWYVL